MLSVILAIDRRATEEIAGGELFAASTQDLIERPAVLAD